MLLGCVLFVCFGLVQFFICSEIGQKLLQQPFLLEKANSSYSFSNHVPCYGLIQSCTHKEIQTHTHTHLLLFFKSSKKNPLRNAAVPSLVTQQDPICWGYFFFYSDVAQTGRSVCWPRQPAPPCLLQGVRRTALCLGVQNLNASWQPRSIPSLLIRYLEPLLPHHVMFREIETPVGSGLLTKKQSYQFLGAADDKHVTAVSVPTLIVCCVNVKRITRGSLNANAWFISLFWLVSSLTFVPTVVKLFPARRCHMQSTRFCYSNSSDVAPLANSSLLWQNISTDSPRLTNTAVCRMARWPYRLCKGL